MKRTYRCPLIGAGTDGNEFRPRTALYAPDWRLREASAPGATECLVEVEADLVTHTTIGLDALIRLIL